MKKTCANSWCKQAFQITEDDLAFYSLMVVPEPKQCPDCRWMRRLCERNSRNLYRRMCDFTQAPIISQYPADAPFPVYCPRVWWSDEWDAADLGQEIDFTRPFFEQYKELLLRVPHIALFVTAEGTMENSEYNNCTGYLKNCYLLGESNHCEDCYYSSQVRKHCKNVTDCSVCYTCERCYDCTDCIDCHTLLYSHNCQNCSESYFLTNCQGCTDCISCVNQRHKQYMIFNVQQTKEDYDVMKEAFHLESAKALEELREKAAAFVLTQPHKNLEMEHVEESLGNHLNHAKNSTMCFDCNDVEDCRYCSRISKTKNSMDYSSWGLNSELIYESSACGYDMYNLKFCSTCNVKVLNAEYCYSCGSSEELFGCVCLRNKKHCILNKQYTKEDYLLMKERLIEHMKKHGEYGEFFPKDLCPFAYNETIAPEYFPLTKEEAIERGYRWRDEESSPDERNSPPLPDSIAECDDAITERVLRCESTGAAYKIIPQELAFYRSLAIPPPHKSPSERHRIRMASRTPGKLFERTCAKCHRSMTTSFSPDRPEIVYCEECYLKEVY